LPSTKLFVLLDQLHDFPKYVDHLLSKFDLKKLGPLKFHIRKFILAIRLMNVQYEYVVYHLFPYTFKKKAFTSHFNLQMGSITSWNDFETTFMNNFGDKQTLEALISEMPRIKMEIKECNTPQTHFWAYVTIIQTLSHTKFSKFP
jgi:hypothetical protein